MIRHISSFRFSPRTRGDPRGALGGTNVDVDEVLAADFGQWDLTGSNNVDIFADYERTGIAPSAPDAPA